MVQALRYSCCNCDRSHNANSVALGTDTTGNYASAVTAGSGITVTGSAGEGTSFAVAQLDTSSQASVSNSGSDLYNL